MRLQLDLVATDPHRLAGIQNLPLDARRPDEGAVGAAEILDHACAPVIDQHGMLPAHLRILEADAAAGIPADRQDSVVQACSCGGSRRFPVQ